MAATTGTYGYGTSDDYFAVTPADGTDLAIEARGLMIAVGGVIKVTKKNGNTETITVPAGFFPGRVTRVWAAGITATGITALV